LASIGQALQNKCRAQIQAIIVELPAGTDLIAEMSQIHTRRNDHQCEPTSFKYHFHSKRWPQRVGGGFRLRKSGLSMTISLVRRQEKLRLASHAAMISWPNIWNTEPEPGEMAERYGAETTVLE
jgi:hypothetical protein